MKGRANKISPSQRQLNTPHFESSKISDGICFPLSHVGIVGNVPNRRRRFHCPQIGSLSQFVINSG